MLSWESRYLRVPSVLIGCGIPYPGLARHLIKAKLVDKRSVVSTKSGSAVRASLTRRLVKFLLEFQRRELCS